MRHRSVILALLLLVAAPARAEVEFRVKTTLVGVGDGGRDLGLLSSKDSQQGYFTVSPWVHAQTGDWGFFLRVEGYAQTDPVLRTGSDFNNVQTEDENYYGALREAWIQYGGLTSYPGEWLRIGRQRIRQNDAQWWDVDIDAVRWVFDTTQIQADFGGARQFNSYRTDDPILPGDQRDRTFAFGSIGGEWLAKHRITARAVYASDDKQTLPAVGTIPGPEDKTRRTDAFWIGLLAHNHYFDWKQPPHFGYWLTATGLIGNLRYVTTDPITGQVVTDNQSDNLGAYATELGGKFALPRRFPVQFGGAYAYSSGARGATRSKQFFQTGVHSNYSRFTGTRSTIYRFNEAYRAELGNLNAATGFLSVDVGRFDMSAVFNQFWKTEGNAPVETGLLVDPVNGKSNLGQGYDLVLAGYFSIFEEQEARPDEGSDVPASALRLRASLFQPGPAYGDGAHDEYRIVAELSLWF